MARPVQLGEGYRGDGGPVGYLLRQTIHPGYACALDRNPGTKPICNGFRLGGPDNQ